MSLPSHVTDDTSTHDLHTEVDRAAWLLMNRPNNFNSRPPHGGRLKRAGYLPALLILQLTTSTRRSTGSFDASHKIRKTSTHDLHTEVDEDEAIELLRSMQLQLTTSTRRSTDPKPPKGYYLDTSTHDLHTEVDNRKEDVA